MGFSTSEVEVINRASRLSIVPCRDTFSFQDKIIFNVEFRSKR